jgi:hypothetical protein
VYTTITIKEVRPWESKIICFCLFYVWSNFFHALILIKLASVTRIVLEKQEQYSKNYPILNLTKDTVFSGEWWIIAIFLITNLILPNYLDWKQQKCKMCKLHTSICKPIFITFGRTGTWSRWQRPTIKCVTAESRCQGPYSNTCCNLRHSKLLQKSSVSKFVCSISKYFYHLSFTI